MAEAVWGSSASMGLHFPQEQLTRITPIFARLLSPLHGFRGWRRNALLHARNLAKTIARDKPVSTFECTRKPLEHGYNITRVNHAPKIFYDHNVSHERNKIHDARMQVIHEKCITRVDIECIDRVSEATPRKEKNHASVGRLSDTT